MSRRIEGWKRAGDDETFEDFWRMDGRALVFVVI